MDSLTRRVGFGCSHFKLLHTPPMLLFLPSFSEMKFNNPNCPYVYTQSWEKESTPSLNSKALHIRK